jgi:UDP-3-O-[3-hydroxymyristoyl] glucosamine N-acyltransferase
VPLRLDEIVERLGGQLAGNGETLVSRIATLDGAGPGDLTFFANPKYRSRLAVTRAAAVIVTAEAAGECPTAAIVTPQPYLYFARVAQWLHAPVEPPKGAHPSAIVQSAVPASASIGAHTYVDAEVVIGEDVVIGANCTLGRGCRIGTGSRLHAGVTVYDGCIVGARAIIHSGAVIGADGFGFAREDDGAWLKIPQTGRVVIGDDVEIGANTAIDRGAIDDTIIEEGVKLDNQIQIGHNCVIGDGTAIAGCTGIAGSTRIGRHCRIGGAAMISGHLTIPDGTTLGGAAVVMSSIDAPGVYSSAFPVVPFAEWRRNMVRVRHLDQIAERVARVERALRDLSSDD